MSIKLGDTLYRYSIRYDWLVCKSGTVSEVNGRRVVIFRDGVSTVRCPRDMDLGVIRSVGPSLWLTERDDGLARRLYLEYEETRLIMLRSQIENKERIVKNLRGEHSEEVKYETT